MVIDHPDSLHIRIYDCAADKAHPAFFKISG